MADAQDSTTLMVEVVISTVILIMNIFGNSLILLVIKCSKYFKHVTCHLVAHVAVADIIFGCCVVLKMIVKLGFAGFDTCYLHYYPNLTAGNQCMQLFWHLLNPCRKLSVSTSPQLRWRSKYDFVQSSNEYCKLLGNVRHPAAASCLRHQPARSGSFKQLL